MRAVIQRVDRARVCVDGDTVGEIARGLLVFVSVGIDDDEGDAQTMADKIAELRIFPDDRGLMNRSIRQDGGAVLLVPQFTLHGDVRRGRRPSFAAAAKEPRASELYRQVGDALEGRGLTAAYGRFGARMDVELVNTGPVTILLDTKRAF
jgi:D-aminoacyl-tRNA deacylase